MYGGDHFLVETLVVCPTWTYVWFVFRENFDRRIALGMLAIVAGAVIVSWTPGVGLQSIGPGLSVLGTCLAWGIDNSTRRPACERETRLGTTGCVE
ncbi:MAG: hypothetical protein ABI885_10740 [Gammaproteobacteria bacterium]